MMHCLSLKGISIPIPLTTGFQLNVSLTTVIMANEG